MKLPRKPSTYVALGAILAVLWMVVSLVAFALRWFTGWPEVVVLGVICIGALGLAVLDDHLYNKRQKGER